MESEPINSYKSFSPKGLESPYVWALPQLYRFGDCTKSNVLYPHVSGNNRIFSNAAIAIRAS